MSNRQTSRVDIGGVAIGGNTGLALIAGRA
jgi:hypothetical protein